MKRFLMAVAASAVLVCSGCDETSVSVSFCSCQSNISSITAVYGEPDEIEKIDSGSYHCHTYWYWCQGLSIVFIWDDGAQECCKENKNTFDPVCD